MDESVMCGIIAGFIAGLMVGDGSKDDPVARDLARWNRECDRAEAQTSKRFAERRHEEWLNSDAGREWFKKRMGG